MRLIVTGATGFIGSSVMQHAARSFPGEVIGIARRVPSSHDNVRYVGADLLDPEMVKRVLAQIEATHLLHLAWDVTPGRYWHSAANLEWLEASLRLFRIFAASGGERIVTSGTCAEYDWTDGLLVEDQTPLQPNSLYGISKNCLREMLEAAAPPLDISWAWARLFWLYGPDERPGRLLSDLARALLAGETVATSAGHQRRDYLHVDDVARALLHVLLGAHQGTINIGSGEGVEIREVVNKFGEYLGRPDLLRIGARAESGDESPLVVADVARLEATGFRTVRNLDTGLADTAEWWKRTQE